MEAIHERIQADVLWFAWLSLLIALPLYGWLRNRGPRTNWHQHGRVTTKPFGLLDLAVIVILFLGLKLSWAWAMDALAPDGTEGVALESGDLTTDVLLREVCVKIILVCFILAFFMLREVNVIEVFGLKRLGPKAVAVWGFVVGILVVPVVIGVNSVSMKFFESYIGELPVQPIVEAFIQNDGLAFRSAAFLLVVVVTPVFEELLYRGYLYGVCKRFSDRFFAAMFSSLVFAAAHPGIISLVPIFTLAMFLALVYELSGSLLVPISIHMFFNFVNLLVMWISSPTLK